MLRNGLFVSFLDFFQGTVDLCHLPVPASAYWASAYEKAQRCARNHLAVICVAGCDVALACSLRCRVLFVNLSAKVIGLSAAPHITSLSPITFEAKYGDVIDPATIVRVDAGVGVTLSFAPLAEAPRKKDADALNALCAWGTTAFCHVSRLSDSRVEYVERSYSVGAVVNCRVVGAWGVTLAVVFFSFS